MNPSAVHPARLGAIMDPNYSVWGRAVDDEMDPAVLRAALERALPSAKQIKIEARLHALERWPILKKRRTPSPRPSPPMGARE